MSGNRGAQFCIFFVTNCPLRALQPPYPLVVVSRQPKISEIIRKLRTELCVIPLNQRPFECSADVIDLVFDFLKCGRFRRRAPMSSCLARELLEIASVSSR